MDWFEAQPPVIQALLGGGVTWGVTAAGAAGVVLLRRIDQRLLDVMLGFAAGVMLAASFWSLLAPAIELAGSLDIPSWLPAASGLALGGLFLRLMDAVLPHLHLGFPPEAAEGPPTHWHRTTLLVTAITLHNIPEGLAVGVAFGAVGAGLELNGAITLTGGAAPSGGALPAPPPARARLRRRGDGLRGSRGVDPGGAAQRERRYRPPRHDR